MAEQDNIVMCGVDIGKKGGVYGVTSRLSDKFTTSRVINTLLDEQSILGLAIGMAHNGFMPIPEIQFLAYVHNAEDQFRGEAATLPFFSKGQFTNPMVIRIAGLAYQKGFGGHFHNDNSFTIFRDIPGVIIACPSNGADAVGMLRECVRLAQQEQRLVVFLEPIALYMTKDLHETGDNLWAHDYVEPANNQAISYGQFNRYGEGKDLCIISYGNGYFLSRQAEKQLAEQGINCTLIDLRWLSDIDEVALAKVADSCDNVLIVDECRHTGSISEALMAMLTENCSKAPTLQRITADDSFIPLGSAAYAVLPSTQEIVDTGLDICGVNDKKSA
jgi:2-oxoisovalerate dehydrogenase E1 component